MDSSGARFDQLGLSAWLVKHLKELGFTKPTPVQTGCIPEILGGKNVLGASNTGSGKTAAFALPILSKLSEDPYGIYALVLTPARELAIQIGEQFSALGHPINLRSVCLIGGGDLMSQLTSMSKQPHIVISTPGRLTGFIRDNPSFHMRTLKFLVLDEVDRLLGKSFRSELRSILDFLPPPSARQTLLFSATMDLNTEQFSIFGLETPFLYNGCKRYDTVNTLKQQYIFIPDLVKECYLFFLAKKMPDISMIVFSNTVWQAELLKRILTKLAIPALALHSSIKQRERKEALRAFRSSYVRVLVATDVASRGLDIPEVEIVVNFDIPQDPADYVHRSGRTARAGRSGTVVSFVTPNDVSLVHAIENTIQKKMELYEMGDSESTILSSLTAVTTAKQICTQRMLESKFGAQMKARRKHEGQKERGKEEKKEEERGQGDETISEEHAQNLHTKSKQNRTEKSLNIISKPDKKQRKV